MRIALTVNGRPVEIDVTPRTSLADLLREHLLLTGTHLGCEHGICGACTVEIDGEIARSCITYAVTCDGARVRSIEGFDDDPLMAHLRRAFTEAHALQCGYCTPGMLVAARDLLRRKSGLSRRDIRHEMSGNLCRCTGYMGIVDAIERVMNRGQTPGATAPGMAIGRAQGPDPVCPQPPREPVRVTTHSFEEADGAVSLTQSFLLPHPIEAVWALMSDPQAVALCMPGARLDGPPQDGRIAGGIEVGLGPIAARFAGAGTVAQFPAEHRQRIEGRGADRKSGSHVAGSVDYRLSAATDAAGGAATRVEVVIAYALTGLLAQLGRSALARDLAQRIGETFAQNLDMRLDARLSGAAAPPAQLGALPLLLAALRARLRALLGRARRLG